MLIRIRRSWEIPERMATPQALVGSRRALIKTVSMLTLATAMARCGPSSRSQNGTDDEPKKFGPGTVDRRSRSERPDPNISLYPAKRNEAYKINRNVTQELYVTSYNNYYEFGANKDDPKRRAFRLTIRPWEISFEGMVEKEFKTNADALIKRMPLEERLYRHRCVEAWSFVAPWTGFPMGALMELAKPTSAAKYVVMKSFLNPQVAPAQNEAWVPWPYTEGLTLAEANNELAFIVTGAYGKPLLKQNGAPLRLATPWKYGFKSIKGIQRFIFTAQRPTTYWMGLGRTEYGFWANVNPQVPHPRWSQSTEEVLGTGMRVPTQVYNGYAEQVVGLYADIRNEPLFM